VELTEKYPARVQWALIVENDRVVHNDEIVRITRIRDNPGYRSCFVLSNGGVAYKWPSEFVHFVGSELGDAISIPD